MTDTSTATTLALIQNNLEIIKAGVDEMKVDIKEINARFATKEEVERQIKQIGKDAADAIANIKAELLDLKASNNFWRIVNPTMAAVLGSVLTFFVISYFTHGAK